MPEVDVLAATLAGKQNGAFAWWQIAGATSHTTPRRRVDAGRWMAHGHGTYSIAGAPHTWEFHLQLAVLEGGRGTVVSHRAAAALFGLSGFERQHLDISRPEARSHRTRQHSTPRKSSLIPNEHVTTVRQFPCTTLARTLFDLSGLTSPQRRRRGWHYLPEGRVVRAVDDALTQLHLPLQSLIDVVDELGKRGRPGTQLMRRITDERSGGLFATESVLEDLFLSVLAGYGIAMPERQQGLGSETEPIGRVDFVYPSIRLVVELDSRKHHSALTDWESDKWRDLRMAASGWRTLRISWRQLTERPAEVAELLRQVLARPA